MLDAKTLILFSIVFLALFSLLGIILYKKFPNQKAIYYFTLYHITLLISLVLLALRHQVSDFLSIVVAQTLVSLAFLFFYLSMRAFIGLDILWKKRYFIPLGVVALGYFLSTYIHYSTSFRMLILSLFIVAFKTALAFFVYQYYPKEPKYLKHLLISSLLFISFMFLIRALYISTNSIDPNYLDATNLFILIPNYALFLISGLYTLLLFYFIKKGFPQTIKTTHFNAKDLYAKNI
jgi:hypothetical protein